MSEIALKNEAVTQTEDFIDGLSDEALDREEHGTTCPKICGVTCLCRSLDT